MRTVIRVNASTGAGFGLLRGSFYRIMNTIVLLNKSKETKLRIFSMLLIYKVFLNNVKKNNTFTYF